MSFTTYNKVILRTPLNSLESSSKAVDLSNELFMLGIYLSSPDLWKEVNNISQNKSDYDKIMSSLSKYWIRSCSRATPYATFAASSVIDLGESTEILIESYKTKNKLDTDLLYLMIESLINDNRIRNSLRFEVNNSLYDTLETFRYADYEIKGGFRDYQLTDLRKTKYLVEIIRSLHRDVGGKTIKEIIILIQSKFDIQYNEAYDYINRLIKSRILISSLEPSLTDSNPLDHILNILENISEAYSVMCFLQNIKKDLNNIKWANIECYSNIESKIKDFFQIKETLKTPFQTDLYHCLKKNTLSKSLIEEVLNQVYKLKVFNKSYEVRDLEDFKNKFDKVYGEGREVPLAIVLDSDLGIGYGIVTNNNAGQYNFTKNLSLGSKHNISEIYYKSVVDNFIMEKLLLVSKRGLQTLEITDEDISILEKAENFINFPIGQYLIGNIVSGGKIENDQNFLFSLKGLGGTSAGNLISRFSNENPEFENLLKEIISVESKTNEDVIFAEIVHLPQARVGNVITRPQVRNFEIPYISRSNLPKSNQIDINDIMVSISNNVVIIKSKSLNKRIIPCLTNAHNYSSSSALPIYKFLCDLQLQNRSTIYWDWGILSAQKNLPRVQYKNIILKPAVWNINIKDFENKNDFNDSLRSIMKKNNIPNFICVKESESDLFLNLNNENHFNLLLKRVLKYKTVDIEESIQTDDNLIVKNKNGEYLINELIIPVLNTKDSHKALPTKTKLNISNVKEVFYPGSEWLYYKIYMGNSQIEKFLSNSFYLFICENKSLYSQFFFIRYYDDIGPHVRLRFYNDSIDQILFLQKKLKEVFDKLSVKTIQIDTYIRETKRYMFSNIENSEQIFFNDSIASLKILNLLQGNEEEYRIVIAMRSIDSLLSDFNFENSEKTVIIGKMRYSFFDEFDGKKVLKDQLNGRYRNIKNWILSHMNFDKDVENSFVEVRQVLEERSVNNRTVINSIYEKISREDILEILPSYIHMSMNRLFASNQRVCELVIYHFLDRYYASQRHLNY